MTKHSQSIQFSLFFVVFLFVFICHEKPSFAFCLCFSSNTVPSPPGQNAGTHGNSADCASSCPTVSNCSSATSCPEWGSDRKQGQTAFHYIGWHIGDTTQNIFPNCFCLSLCWFHGKCPLLIQIIQIAPMPVVQPQLPQGGAVHSAGAFPVTMGTAAVVAPGSAPSQAVLLPPAHTRYKHDS